jgi:hypothetical protein
MGGAASTTGTGDKDPATARANKKRERYVQILIISQIS